MLAIYGLIVGVVLGAARSIPDFMIFMFVGLIAWNLFASIINGSISSLMTSASLISKASFPRILLPIAALVVALVDALFQVAVLILAYAIVGSWPSLQGFIYLLPSFVVLISFGLGLGLILAAANVYVRDVNFLTDVALQVGFWLCPILYSYGLIVKGAEAYGWSVDLVTQAYLFNPMANVVLGFQMALWPPAATSEGSVFSFPVMLDQRLLIFAVIGLLFLSFSVWLFRRLGRNFAQEL
jgi:ABC-2 type transport system permease protein